MKPLVIEDCPTGQCWEVTARFRQRRCECGAQRFAAEGGKCGIHATGGYDAMGEEQKAHWGSVVHAEIRATRTLDHWRALALRQMGWRPSSEWTPKDGTRLLLARKNGRSYDSRDVSFKTLELAQMWLSDDAATSGEAQWRFFMVLPPLPVLRADQKRELRALLAEQDQITKRLGGT